MRLSPHLGFAGQCQEAFEFYERCFQGKILTMMTYAGSPMADQVPAEFRGKIMHATLKVGESIVFAADNPPDQHQPPTGFYMVVGLGDPVEAERIFSELSENGTVKMPLQQTFWAVRFGIVVDRFGVSWEINCEQPR